MKTRVSLKYFVTDCSIKNTVFELPHELLSDLRLRKLRHIKAIKISNFVDGSFG